MLVLVILMIMIDIHDQHHHRHSSHNRLDQTLESDLHALTSELGEVDRRLALLRLSLPPAYSRYYHCHDQDQFCYHQHFDST